MKAVHCISLEFFISYIWVLPNLAESLDWAFLGWNDEFVILNYVWLALTVPEQLVVVVNIEITDFCILVYIPDKQTPFIFGESNINNYDIGVTASIHALDALLGISTFWANFQTECSFIG